MLSLFDTQHRNSQWIRNRPLRKRVWKNLNRHCGWQEEPTILIYRLLLRMHDTVQPTSFVLPLKRVKCLEHNLIWRAFRPSITRNLITSNRCRPHSLTFGYHYYIQIKKKKTYGNVSLSCKYQVRSSFGKARVPAWLVLEKFTYRFLSVQASLR